MYEWTRDPCRWSLYRAKVSMLDHLIYFEDIKFGLTCSSKRIIREETHSTGFCVAISVNFGVLRVDTKHTLSNYLHLSKPTIRHLWVM